jgi:hypothetical protein
MVEFAQAAQNCNPRKPWEKLRQNRGQLGAGRVRLTDCKRARTTALDEGTKGLLLAGSSNSPASAA